MIKDQYIVDFEETDLDLPEIRVDKYLVEVCEDLSRTEIQEYFELKLVTVNKKIVKPSFKVKNGDVIDIESKPDEPIYMLQENIKLDIVYEDEDVIVVNKPSIISFVFSSLISPQLASSITELVNSSCRFAISGSFPQTPFLVQAL